jgi:multiple sugar transport system substrate-binding protein
METTSDHTLKGITWDHVRGYGPLHASVQPYSKETGITIRWEKRSLKDFGDASLDQLSRIYDLIILDHPHSGMAASTQAVVPLDDVLNKTIIDDALTNSVGPSFKSYWYENHLWALPIDAACQVSSYRKNLFNSSSLPQTWNDVFSLAHDLRHKKQFIGMALCATDCNCSFLTLCAQLGDPFGEGKFVSERTLRGALDVLQKIYAISHPESITWNPIRLYDHMAAENDVLYCPLAFGYTNYARQGYAQNTLSFGSVPGRSNALLGGAGIAVSKYGKNVPQAAAYAAWLCSENFQKTHYVEAGGQPAHKKAWLDDRANELTGDFFSNTLSTIEEAYVRPRNHNWPSFQEELGEILFSFLIHKKTTYQVCKEIKNNYEKFFPSKRNNLSIQSAYNADPG